MKMYGPQHCRSRASLANFVVVNFSVIKTTRKGLCTSHCRFGEDYCDGSCLYGCEAGYTGIDCQHQCSIDRCLQCEGSITAQNCTLCEVGYYGNLCQHRCSRNCKFGDKKCDRDGRCLYGCGNGFFGDDCKGVQCPFSDCEQCSVTYAGELYCQKCIDGKYYDYSSKQCVPCSEHCLLPADGIPACNSTTGVCFNGCNNDYFGMLCDKTCTIANCTKCRENAYNNQRTHCSECEVGFYLDVHEERCLKCSEHCAGGYSNCNAKDGNCMNGCEKGWVGRQCNQPCNIPSCAKCVTNAFETLILCQQCDTGYYVSSYECVQCSPYCQECNGTNGVCMNGCIGDRYGRYCDVNCSANCFNESCNPVTGHCLYGCNDGWFSEYCDRRCPKECGSCEPFFVTGKCDSCSAGWYGDLCEKKCNENCMRSNFNNFLYCDKDDGSCRDGCNNGYHGDMCNLTCSEHCQERICERNTGYCTYGCTYNRYGRFCESKCPDNCVDVAMGDLPCIPITGHCKTTCKDGFYGDFCNSTCPTNCKYKACTKVQGTCQYGCEPGFYGNSCNLTCPSSCKDNACYQSSGECINGCADGKSGRNCTLSCSKACKGMVCNMLNGFCLHGCENGYYGNTCRNVCSNNCFNQTCTNNGTCKYGCVEGKMGSTCGQDCPIGRFGRNCTEKCGLCKENTICEPEFGICELGCAVGYTTSQCKTRVEYAPQYAGNDGGTDTIAVAGSATAAILLTIIVIVVVAIVVRKKNLQACAKNRESRNSVNETDMPMETFGFSPETEEDSLMTSSRKASLVQLDILNLQIYDELACSRELKICQIKTGKYCDSLVHVKVISKTADGQNHKLFVHELDTLKSIKHHANIVTLLGFCFDQDHMYHVFRPCDQGDLLRYMQRLRHSSADWSGSTFKSCFTELMQFILDVLSGLQFIHQNMIVHRLIAATSIYVDQDYVAKIGNFYFAKKVQESSEAESSMAIWSFGVLLWEVTSMGQNVMDLGGKFPKMAPYACPQGCDRQLYRIMEQCWRVTPSTRPTVEELIEKVTNHIDRQKDIMNEDYPMLASTTV
ncbi:hypothetical protein FSP39_009726 [Pinctada imbricata]|uniref:Protein kinase domain-containing protein n=1 Tax=Pinctada imbricata TaxID=66713 RepID=A0AA89BTA0_PINIB|nr:hypothetical protein FSP39_009726 [Pinctada imbricata]